ncbi:hypothetical protein Tco_1206079, partial [Tanacetum coccineum]
MGSQKQTTVSLSSCETEFMAAIAIACQTIWLRELLVEVTGLERQKVIIRVDNKSTTALSKNPVFMVQGDEVATWCARVSLFDSEIQGVIVGEFMKSDYGLWRRLGKYEHWSEKKRNWMDK